MARSRAALRALTAAALLLPLAACGGKDADDGAAPAKKAAGFPYTVTNCGVKTTFDAPPERAVALNQHATELLLALGLKEKMAGSAYLDDAVLPAYQKDYDQVKVLAEEYPSKEVLLGANPDFVYGGYDSAFDKAQGRDRAGLEKSGIRTRLNTESCADRPVGMAQLRTEITELARTFGVPERGAQLIADEEKQVGAVRARLAKTEPLKVFVYDSGEASAFTAGGQGIGNELISLAGGRNVFADVKKSFADVSWEQVVERKPEVVVIYDYGGTTVEQKKQRLLKDPALKDVPAVRNKRFAVLPLSSAVLGVRVGEAADALAGQLHPDAR
ncbi:ABC transporter substrate-binding protein [Streptomyces lichenis]|uniref:ABC transporter substrate-binding protein n=1 Tax=Streptomyces lichenis TaxID=2306967 RepID=A0ABT0I8P2_9ACTN|nr:ABC transporter substrate-binding protein [Streptomyces lichenis]MCK8677690.1 ABC transporter substrate-binding protein [Streptomyces lichenis]